MKKEMIVGLAVLVAFAGTAQAAVLSRGNLDIISSHTVQQAGQPLTLTAAVAPGYVQRSTQTTILVKQAGEAFREVASCPGTTCIHSQSYANTGTYFYQAQLRDSRTGAVLQQTGGMDVFIIV
ncbi:MAG: hypothetical protein HY520_04115 [Candidatus Aenigmarchaeota archaeon]|nr:hypothetical protein [Candidatus Aenigmarchaeota archaeon]